MKEKESRSKPFLRLQQYLDLINKISFSTKFSLFYYTKLISWFYLKALIILFNTLRGLVKSLTR